MPLAPLRVWLLAGHQLAREARGRERGRRMLMGISCGLQLTLVDLFPLMLEVLAHQFLMELELQISLEALRYQAELIFLRMRTRQRRFVTSDGNLDPMVIS